MPALHREPGKGSIAQTSVHSRNLTPLFIGIFTYTLLFQKKKKKTKTKKKKEAFKVVFKDKTLQHVELDEKKKKKWR